MKTFKISPTNSCILWPNCTLDCVGTKICFCAKFATDRASVSECPSRWKTTNISIYIFMVKTFQLTNSYRNSYKVSRIILEIVKIHDSTTIKSLCLEQYAYTTRHFILRSWNFNLSHRYNSHDYWINCNQTCYRTFHITMKSTKLSLAQVIVSLESSSSIIENSHCRFDPAGCYFRITVWRGISLKHVSIRKSGQQKLAVSSEALDSLALDHMKLRAEYARIRTHPIFDYWCC
jgi:hypothetical protein